MSYLFVAYLWEKRRFDPKVLVECWNEATPCFAGEELVQLPVNSRIDAAFYFAGNFSTKSEAFAHGCETMLVDGYAEAPSKALLDAGKQDFRYVVWLSSDMFEYDVALRFEGHSFEGRGLIDGHGERVSIVDAIVTDYEYAETSVDPAKFGANGEDDAHFDEDAYHRAVEEREKLFWPGGLVRDTLRIKRDKVISALYEKGKTLWPEGGAQDTPKLRKAIKNAESFAPALPLWDDLGQQFAAEKKKAVRKKSVAKRGAAR